ncbi:MAG: hypothetical protein HC849_23380 [Oscillatoriales cyanobacterium RU_3_3]|nr:hypothetical protein [Microcoleus sp. SU_5_6]NJM62469.1 hypothetical protein [Oscillatoriales cyanobacterium RU_3_3]NJS42186.1 hypothetical protein [Candidatus Gracilibacteria bacterium]
MFDRNNCQLSDDRDLGHSHSKTVNYQLSIDRERGRSHSATVNCQLSTVNSFFISRSQ